MKPKTDDIISNKAKTLISFMSKDDQDIMHVYIENEISKAIKLSQMYRTYTYNIKWAFLILCFAPALWVILSSINSCAVSDYQKQLRISNDLQEKCLKTFSKEIELPHSR
jgi:hypothetical protein